MHPSALELSEAKKWLINFPDNYGDDKIQDFCANPPGNSKCEYKGHPSEDGLDFAEFTGTKAELDQVLVDHDTLKPDFVEPDTPVTAIPEVDQEEDDASPSLMEVGSVPWGLDRIDDKSGKDGSYNAPAGSSED